MPAVRLVALRLTFRRCGIARAFKEAPGGDSFHYDPHTHEMMRMSGDVVPGISVIEYRAHKVSKGQNLPAGPSSYVVSVYTGTPGSRRKLSDRLASMKDVVAFVQKHAEQAAAAVSAEMGEGVVPGKKPGRSSGKKFKALVAKLRKQKGVRDPEALAAWIGLRAAGEKGGEADGDDA